MANFQQLPIDILHLIFDYLKEKEDIKSCRLVCLQWCMALTYRLFQDISIKDEYHLKALLDLTTSSKSNRLIQLGQYAKTMTIYSSRDYKQMPVITRHDFEQLVKSCPHVHKLLLDAFTFGKYISAYLLDISDDTKWKVQSFGLKHITMDIYYKYKDSITEFYAPYRMKSIRDLAYFPLLQQVYLHAFPITTMEDFMFIFDACRNIRHISMTVDINTPSHVACSQDLYLSLTRAEFVCRGRQMPKSLIDCITHRFTEISDISFYLDNESPKPIDGSDYDRLVKHVVKHLRKESTLSLYKPIFNAEHLEQAAIAINNCLKSLSKQSSITSSVHFTIVQSMSWDNETVKLLDTFKRHDDGMVHRHLELHCPGRYPLQELIYYLRNAKPYIQELTMMNEDSSSVTSADHIDATLYQCRQLQKLALFRYGLPSLQGCVNRAVRSICIASCNIHTGFFGDLATAFPHLKNIDLRCNTIVCDSDGTGSNIIDLGSLILDRLTLVLSIQNDMFASDTQEYLVSLKTHRKTSYFVIDNKRSPKKLSTDEATEKDKSIDYLINCHDVHQFALDVAISS
ncbi:hypothetical protein CU097_010855 [Rhizopus azygosporus]|uniref:F-box domain-containing protein n=2 Tax=Rhizopus TaxID=4842 RepID=A0A367JR92_RHIAZ|nr:hypothetical protein BCV71DRAFT_91439 [Rhizopus microsporus]RCH92463.1 hypothetical protein CU097_010855 [Rhizopus azygosporus]